MHVYITVIFARSTSQWLILRLILSHLTFTCSKSAIDTLEQGVKLVQIEE